VTCVTILPIEITVSVPARRLVLRCNGIAGRDAEACANQSLISRLRKNRFPVKGSCI
jgi:hypothetical protein